MSTRGPKIRTLSNSSGNSGGFNRSPLEPTAKLNLAARREFKRLVTAVSSKGLAGRVDAGHLTLCAILTAELAAVLEEGEAAKNIKVVSQLTTQIRGLKREMGLTLIPSRSALRASVVPDQQDGDRFAVYRSKLS